MNQPTDWTPALIAAGIGLGIGIIATFRMRSERKSSDLTRRDEAAGWDDLSAQLRSAREAEDSDPELAHHRYSLELRAAELLLAKATRGEEEEAEVEAPAAAARPAWMPALWGAVAMAAILLPIMLVQSNATERGQGGSITGNTGPAGGSAAQQAPQGQPRAPIAAIPPKLKPLLDRVEAEPNNVPLRLELTRNLIGAGAMIPAYEQANAVLKLDPKQPEAMSFLAIVRIEMGLPSQAIELLNEAIELKPELIEAWIYRGVAHLRAGTPQAALDDWKQAITLRPDAETVLKPMMERAGKMLRGELPTPKPPAAPSMARGAHPPSPMAGGAGHPGGPVGTVGKPAPAAGGASVSVLITAAPGLTIKPSSTLFLIGRPAGVAGGPPAAVKRLTVSMLPMQVTLTAADTMMGGALPPVLDLTARVDADGDPMTKNDGPRGAVAGVKAGAAAPASLVIGAP